MESVVSSDEEKMGKFSKWEVESAAETLQKAMEIKKDTELMGQVKKILKTKIASIQDLKDLMNGSYEDDKDED